MFQHKSNFFVLQCVSQWSNMQSVTDVSACKAVQSDPGGLLDNICIHKQQEPKNLCISFDQIKLSAIFTFLCIIAAHYSIIKNVSNMITTMITTTIIHTNENACIKCACILMYMLYFYVMIYFLVIATSFSVFCHVSFISHVLLH